MRACGALTLLIGFAALAGAQPKQPDPKDLPKISFVKPVGAGPGTTTRFTVRGLKLDTAKGLQFHEPKTTGRILSRIKVSAGDPKTTPIVGDTQLEIEVRFPGDSAGVLVPFAVENAAGRGAAYRLVVDRWPTVAEKEPNNGFRQAQPVNVPQAVEGCIDRQLDVDVYRFAGKAGQQVVLELFAARCGGPLDSLLTLFDADGKTLATSDDIEGSADSRIEHTLPRDGDYFVSVMDAHDQGGPAHVYRLVLREKR